LHSHFVWAALPAGESEFAGQPAQSKGSLLPSEDKYVPAGQASHVAVPETSLYVPAPHTVQDPPSGPEYPALHVQFVCAMLSASESEFAGQAVQSEASALPSVVKNLPETQLWQTPSEFAPVSGENLPLPQPKHVALDGEPVSGEYFPAPHATQSRSASLPSVVKNLPAMQLSHVPSEFAPVPGEYLPLPHSTQSPSASLPRVLRYVPA